MNSISYDENTFFKREILEKIQLPKNIMVVGYGAIGKSFCDIILSEYPNVNLTICDFVFDDAFPIDKKIKVIEIEVIKENLDSLLDNLSEGDILVDLSFGICCVEIWSGCMKRGVMYLNTALVKWADEPLDIKFKDTQELYNIAFNHIHDTYRSNQLWNKTSGPTAVLDHGANPGLISHFFKRGLFDAAEYFLENRNKEEFSDLNFEEIKLFLEEKNYSKLAQTLGLFSIHCSEVDNQLMCNPPNDTKTKFYNTWSCIGLFFESSLPIQAALGSHEDKTSSDKLPRINDRLIMSWDSSRNYLAKSWIPFENIEGMPIQHGEQYSISTFLRDETTGYSPTQHYVYKVNPHAKEFFDNLSEVTNLFKPEFPSEVIHPLKHKLSGYDKLGALLLFKNNRGWWTGSIMDEYDSSKICDGKYGPTVLQVAAGVCGAFYWMCLNSHNGCKLSEDLDTDFILNYAKRYIGRFLSQYVDLKTTHIKDCYKFEDFLSK